MKILISCVQLYFFLFYPKINENYFLYVLHNFFFIFPTFSMRLHINPKMHIVFLHILKNKIVNLERNMYLYSNRRFKQIMRN